MESSTIALNNGKPSRPPPPTRIPSYSTVESVATAASQPLQLSPSPPTQLISPTEIDKMRKDIIEANLEPQSETDMTQSPSDDDDVVVVTSSTSGTNPFYTSSSPSSSSTSLPRIFENLKIRELRNSSISEVDDATLMKGRFIELPTQNL